MSDDIVNLEVDGKPVTGRKGQMLIEVTDSVGAYVPRFCYHEKLSIAANCRMCLIDIVGAPKPIPACAQPITEGMKVFTKSPRAIAAQKATMEFLLINHPLDCPICDQGGECELQDLAMGYGRDISRYNDGKRVVKDKDIGPLVSTDMTRCIHCTRCVRFGEEIQGNPQLGTVERGEQVKISTYVEQNVDHELSANIIDLCPVGALNNKPYRYSARAWEMEQRATISPHDCVGSNLYAHVLRGTVKRIVPRDNEAINETWISDRDRFSYEAIYAADRLKTPRIKSGSEWRELDWSAALERAAEVLGQAKGDKLGVIASPAATVEESSLLSRLADHLGTNNIDHRIGRRDVSDQDKDPVFETLGCSIDEIEQQGSVLVVGSNIRNEAPIIAHRLRKAALKGCKVNFANAQEYEYFFDVADYRSGRGLVELLSGIAVAAADGRVLPDSIAKLCKGVSASDADQRIAAALKASDESLILLGAIAGRHAAYSAIRALGAAIATLTGAKLGNVTMGPNSAGASLAGVLPHRTVGGKTRGKAGKSVAQMLESALDAVLLVNVEPDADIHATVDAVNKLKKQKFVIALTPFATDALLECADLLLPIGTFAETSGTYVNVAGTWQSFGGVANPVGEARPCWKVLRVLGNLLNADGFDYVTSEDVLAEIKATLGKVDPGSYKVGGAIARPNGADAPADEIDTPLYSMDGLVRRANALQKTLSAKRAAGSD
ncbi:MAG: NADH-quinone oxidoreductase subunit NuoG [Gammaproteobacteria bacterium]|nr:NADH-quinone oxidoreductase subunit NuoG [Gammaproteobacteria bacterium]MDH5242019.1 NADH-quinone oxidoreductase subunit NuoG [Gammaproteobacteria bacterium]MDH5583750.1 NADH-quinone oxidoreductase subunit NuoG [Gammaproteobacteria bacterium]